MAKKNYKYEKRQKDIAKKKKREEKLQRKINKNVDAADENSETVTDGNEIEENAENEENIENQDKTDM